MKRRHKTSPSLSPKRTANRKGYDDGWWYEDERGITIHTKVPPSNALKIVCLAIPWAVLVRAARRCGRVD